MLAGAGCLEEPAWFASVTEQGYVVLWQGEEIPEEIRVAFDDAIDRSYFELAKYGLSLERFELEAGAIQYYVQPGAFRSKSSSTGWAAGQAYLEYRVIEVAWWILDNPKRAPALGHEIGHFTWGPTFEHGWTPPLVVGWKPRTEGELCRKAVVES